MIYNSTMATTPYPIAMPDELLADVRRAARETGLSQADVIRQSVKAGLGKVRKQFSTQQKLRPFTKAEARRAFAPDPEWDALENILAKRYRRRTLEVD
jgi:hypothetical protein